MMWANALVSGHGVEQECCELERASTRADGRDDGQWNPVLRLTSSLVLKKSYLAEIVCADGKPILDYVSSPGVH